MQTFRPKISVLAHVNAGREHHVIDEFGKLYVSTSLNEARRVRKIMVKATAKFSGNLTGYLAWRCGAPHVI